MDMIFICSKYRGDIKKNVKAAYDYCRLAVGCEYIPIAPHTIFPNYINDDDEVERLKGIRMGLELMKRCKAVWVFGVDVSEGMELEIKKAVELKLPITFYDLERRRIDHDTIDVDHRLSERLKEVIRYVDSNSKSE